MRLMDTRGTRFEQAVVVVVLLAGFVFSQRWSIVVAAVVAAVGAVLGDRSPLGRAWIRLLDRRRPQPDLQPAVDALRQLGLVAALLAVASLFVVLDLVALAAVVGAVVAMIAALGATGVWNAAAEIERRRRA
jgi:hypothetical protein